MSVQVHSITKQTKYQTILKHDIKQTEYQAILKHDIKQTEYQAILMKQVTKYQYRLQLSHMGINTVPIICGDNTASIKLTSNQGVSDRTKHIDVRHHHIRELV